MTKERLFVYGTLRRGDFNHRILKCFDAKFLAEGSVRGQLTRKYYGTGVPTLEPGDERVQGEVFEIPATCFPALDIFERGYKRVPTEVLTKAGSTRAWVYWWQGE